MAENLQVSGDGQLVVGGSSERLESLNLGGAHVQPRVEHSWLRDGWTPFKAQLVSDESGGAALQSVSVASDRGRITNSGTPGNVRIAYAREGTTWENSEICSLWYGGSIFDSGTCTPQMGQFHRGYIDDTGRWRAVVITNNIFLTDVNVINQNVWNHDPTQADQDALDLGSNGTSKTYASQALGRRPVVRAVTRVLFGVHINQYMVQPEHLWGLTAGVPVTVTSLDATCAFASPVAITAVDPVSGSISINEEATMSTLALKVDTGIITPTTESAKRYWPYWVRSQLVGTVLRVKAWRYMEPEPDWSSTDHVIVTDFAFAANPEPTARMPVGEGKCGLIGAHLRNSATMDYGQTTFARLA